MNLHSAAIRQNIHRYNRDRSFDRSFYLIMCRASDGDVYTAERVIKNEGSERDLLVEDIAKGQVENVMAVLEFNPIESWAKNSSEEIAQKIFDAYGVTDACREFLEDQLGCDIARVA